MLNILWLGMMIVAVLCGLLTGHLDDVILSVTDSCKFAFSLALSLAGIMTFWLGIMELAKASDLLTLLARFLKPVMCRLFPDIPAEDPAMGAMILHLSAHMLGLGNASTPMGLVAMKELDRLNHHRTTASNAMCTFLAINTSCIQLIPTTSIAVLAANGASQPTEIIISAFLATAIGMCTAICVVRYLSTWKRYQPALEEVQPS